MKNHRDFDAHLEQVLALAPEAIAVHTESGDYTWRQLGNSVDKVTRCFDDLALPTGSKIGVIASNGAATVIALVAVIRSGHCFVTFNPMHSNEKIAAELESLQLHAIIGHGGTVNSPPIAEAVAQHNCAVIETHEESADISTSFHPGANAVEHSQPTEGVAVLMQSSGTTGTPKRIPLKYSGLLHPISDQLPDTGAEGLRAKSTPAVIASPLAHIGGLFFALKSVIDARPQILMGRFDVNTWVDAVSTHQLKLGHLVPTTVKMVLDAQVPKTQLASLKVIICGSAALRPEVQQAFEERYGIPILVVYGATEFAGGIAGWSLPLHRQFMPEKLGSVGRAFPGSSLRIADAESGEELPPGSEGILEVRSVQSPQGRDTWVATTDIAILDEDDFLWIRGRADAAINRGGFKILPGEVERVLLAHPQVKDAVVVALDDDRLGQVPAAVVVAQTDQLQLESLQAHAKRELSAYQVPATFLTIEAIPLNASLKPDLPAIRSLFDKQP